MDKREERDELGELFDAVYRDAVHPPADYEASLDEVNSVSVPDEEVAIAFAAVRDDLFPRKLSFGALIRRRREVQRTSIDRLARRSGLTEEQLELLERDRLDLATTPESRIGRVLSALGLELIDDLQEALRQVASQHLSVTVVDGPVHGRTRRGTTSYERRSGLSKGIGRTDEAATARVVENYLRAVERAIVTGSNRNAPDA